MSTRWRDQARAGRAGIDAEHQVELALLAALEQSVREGDDDRAREVLGQLVEHTNVHFMSEQLLMRLAGYPQYEAHVHEHDDLLARARTLQRHVASGEVALSLAFLESTRAWLLQHMDTRDRALADWLDDQDHVAPDREPGTA
jgi:hemerythrin